MVVVEYLYEDMKRLVNLPLEKMVEGLSALGAPSEYEAEVKKIITELTPNRPDWYSMEGLARALRAYYFKERPGYVVKKSDYEVIVDRTVSEVRPYTACAVVKGLKFDDRRITDAVLLQEKLLGTLGRKVKKFGLGIYPLHAISFPVRYTTMKPDEIRYIPLGHENEMSAAEILSQHKKGQQYGHLIKHFERYPVFVDAKGRIMALIPIVNSAETGKVDAGTEDIFIEVSGTDLGACKAALNILVCTFADMGGAAYEVKVRYGKETLRLPDLEPKKMKLDLAKANKLLGLELKEKEAVGLLERMGYGYAKGQIMIPPYRADILAFVDIIEDMAIAYGYNRFTATLPDFFSVARVERTYEHLDETMRSMGFLEIKTFILTNKEKLGRIGQTGKLVEIANPSSADFTVVRPNLVSDMLECLATNKMRGLPQRFYEIGLAQMEGSTETRLVFGVMDKKLEFSEAKGYLQTLMEEVRKETTLAKTANQAFDPIHSADVIVGGKMIGAFGKIEKKVLESYGLEFEVYICELDAAGLVSP